MNNLTKIYWITGVTVLGGFLFGLNMAGISGAVNSIRDVFDLSEGGVGLVVSALTLGCLAGSLFTGSLADRFGRRRLFLAVAVLFIVSSVGCALAQSPTMLIAFRLLAGLAVGADSVIGPMYISEMAPAEKRGRLVSFQQFAIVIGILLAYLIDYALLGFPDAWRWMLSVPALFGMVFLLLAAACLPESIRWQPVGKAGAETAAARTPLRALFRGATGRVVLLGTLLAAFQQITGINAVVNYAPIIFEQTGVGGGTALLQSCLVGVVNFLATIVALWLVDTRGRKVLLLWGAAGMILSLAYLSCSFACGWPGMGVLAALLVYIAFFAASFAPVMWVVTSEIFPDRIRARALSFSTCVSWICTFLTVQFSPWILSKLGGATLFALFGLFSVAALLFVWRCIPETKGKTLEQIEEELGLDKTAKG